MLVTKIRKYFFKRNICTQNVMVFLVLRKSFTGLVGTA